MSFTRDIKRRLQSVQNTKKVTHTMELISAVKMRKAVDKVLAMRPYAQASLEILNSISSRALKYSRHPLLEKREGNKILVVFISSDKGLCGGYNATLNSELKNLGLKNAEFILIGKKGEGMVKKLKTTICHPELVSGSRGNRILNANNINDITELSKKILEDFENKKYDKVIMIYTDYINSIKQKVQIRQLLPISADDLKNEVQEMKDEPKSTNNSVILTEPRYNIGGSGEIPVVNNEKNQNNLNKNSIHIPYLIEPGEQEVLDVILPRLIEIQLFHGISESRASEESSRLMAMKSATDTAGEMVENLGLQYNRQRQAKITQEIAEISSH